MLRLFGAFLSPMGAQAGTVTEGVIAIEGGRIAAVLPGAPPAAADMPAAGTVVPGFIDLQINGAYGHDFMNAPESVVEVARRLPETGVTGFLPTIVAAPAARYAPWLAAITEAGRAARGACVLGLHLEGPFLNVEKKATNRPELLRAPDLDALREMLNDFVRIMTLAPELPGALDLVAELRRRGIVAAAGHSMATYDEAMAAFAAGVNYGTHLGNAMRGLHHRELGLFGALLASAVPVGVIVDGIHLHPELVRLAYRLKGVAGITLVTDTIAAFGMPPGRYALGTRTVEVDETTARVAVDGGYNLAGAVLSMDAAVRNMMAFTGCSLAEAVTMASATPARVLGLARKGQIAPGFDADLTVLDADGGVVMTLAGGEVVYQRAASTEQRE